MAQPLTRNYQFDIPPTDLKTWIVVKRFVAILLVLGLLSLVTGATEALHNRQHAREDAALATAGATHDSHHHPLHDENNCPVHAQLHLPMIPAAWVPLLFFLGLFVAFLTPPAPRPVARLALAHIDCRGPPPPR